MILKTGHYTDEEMLQMEQTCSVHKEPYLAFCNSLILLFYLGYCLEAMSLKPFTTFPETRFLLQDPMCINSKLDMATASGSLKLKGSPQTQVNTFPQVIPSLPSPSPRDWLKQHAINSFPSMLCSIYLLFI